MSLWDQLPSSLRDAGDADGLRPLLDGLDGTGPTETTDGDGTWSTYTATQDLTGPLSLDPRTGAFSSSSGATGTPIELPDPHVGVELSFHLTGSGGTRDGGWKVVLAAPSVRLRLPFLRGAMLDSFGHLRSDPANPTVAFTLPALRVRVRQLAGQAVGVDLLSATTGGTAVDQLYELIEMSPPYALIGPSDVVGFGFRTAVLDLSGTAGPSGVPAMARAMPTDWQGLYLPEARLFVAPEGLEGLAVFAGVENLWIGVGVHEGVTGVFEAEVVNRGSTPTIVVRFVTGAGQAISFTGDTALLPEHTTVYAEASGGLGAYDVRIDVGGTLTSGDRAPVTTPAAGTASVTVTLLTPGTSSVVTSRTITVTRSTAAVGTGSSGGDVTLRTTSHETVALALASQTTTSARVRLTSGASATWTWPGGTSTGTVADVPVAAGATVSVQAQTVAAQVQSLDAYFRYDHPAPSEGGDWVRNPANVGTEAAADAQHQPNGVAFVAHAAARLATVGAGTRLTVSGYASYEGHDDSATEQHNLALSVRRRSAMRTALTLAGYTNLADGTANGATEARDRTSVDGEAPAPRTSGKWWRARAVSDAPAAAVTVTGQLVRRPVTPPLAVDPTPARAAPPDCFHRLGVRVELVRSTFVRCEVYGEIDIETAAESQLRRKGQPALGSTANPADGICTFLARLRIAADQGSWEVSAEFRAKDSDLDGLWERKDSNTNQLALDVLGALSVLAPLSSAATELSPAAGAVVELGALALGASDLIHTKRLTLRGAEVIVSQGVLGADGTTTVANRGTQVSVLFDIEVAFHFDLTIIKVDPAKPIVTRYKAIGVRSSWGEQPGAGGGVDYVPLPVFDPSRGYSLDIPAGSLTASPPLDEVLRILGVKVSRQNPTYLEVEVGLGLDLGVVKVDTVRVRARVDGPPLDLQLTKLGASVTIPNVITGRGYLAFDSTGFSGSFDLQIIPLKLRASATLAVHRSPEGVTGVLLGIEVEFPVPLVLGSSGLGLFGLMAGVGVNMGRVERTDVQVPALEWLQAQMARGGVMDPDGWSLQPGHYAFAAGVLLGTLEGGYVVHLKGIVLIEVPGPRLLFIMKADVLSEPPTLKEARTATFLAVLDLDFGRGTITIGIVAQYEIDSILKIRVPVVAFFDTNHVEKWFVELGSYTDRVTVEVLDVISGSGYLMVHGDGVSVPGLPAVSSGLGIATGFHISAVLMGSKSIGLYLEVAAGFDAVVGFDPPFIAGTIYARGELRLFVISIGASAELTVKVGKRLENGTLVDQPYVHGEVCGSIDLFFFEIKGCVSLTIGDEPDDDPAAKPLVAGVTLTSRSPALVEGSATGRSVDGSLGDARDTTDPSTEPLVTVPLDAIPVIRFATPPEVTAGAVMGADAFGPTGIGANPWVRIGERWWRYEVQSVTLTAGLLPADGKTPATWWTGVPAGTTAPQSALALLNWLPTPFSRAVPYGEQLTTSVTEQWGTVCHPAAPAAPVLWTFDGKPYGPNGSGWNLVGVPWPDPVGTVRSAPVEADLAVDEPWRTHDATTDLMQGTTPAMVVAGAVPCTPARAQSVRTMASSLVRDVPAAAQDLALPVDAHAQAVRLLQDGVPLAQVAAQRSADGWSDAASAGDLGCRGAVLRSPEHDRVEPAPFGTPEDAVAVTRVRARSSFAPDELRDAVRLTARSSVRQLALLMMVPERALGGLLVLRLEDSTGAVRRHQPVQASDRIGAANPLPPQLLDATGPWFDPMLRSVRMGLRVASGADPALTPVWVRLRDLPDDVRSVVVGWDAGARGVDLPAFYVVAVEGLLAGEVARESWDTTTTAQNVSVLQSALTQDPDDRALLAPGQTCTVSVQWRAAWKKQDDRPGAGEAPTWQPSQTQSYSFATEPASAAPADLGPWLLATTPGMDDVGVFCTTPVRIALATQKVAELFGAYGKELRVVVQSASGTHPAPPGGTPGSPWTLPTGLGDQVTAASLHVRTPWEEAVRQMITEAQARGEMPCIDGTGSRTDQLIVTLPYDFEPLTDYLVDVHSVDVGSPPTARNLVHRIGFTTSRFTTLDDFVAFVAPVSVRGRLVPTPGGLTTLPDAPTGGQVDEAYQAAGLTVPQAPRYPAVEVLWSGDAVPQPVAVVIESSEPLWRSRVAPEVVTGPVDAADPTHHWWAPVRRDWLSLEASTAAAGPGDLPRASVTRIIRCPGRTRAVVLLGPGARGTEARLDLVLAADDLAGTAQDRRTAARVPLVAAPWEMED